MLRPAPPAEQQRRGADEQRHLDGLDDEHGQDLGGDQLRPRQGRSTEPLQDAVGPVVCRRDPEADEARRDDRERDRPRQEEVHRPAGVDRNDGDRAEEQQHDDRQDGGRDEGLAATKREAQLHRGHREDRAPRRARRDRRSPSTRSRRAPPTVAADQLQVALLERSAARAELDDQDAPGGAPAGEHRNDLRRWRRRRSLYRPPPSSSRTTGSGLRRSDSERPPIRLREDHVETESEDRRRSLRQLGGRCRSPRAGRGR